MNNYTPPLMPSLPLSIYLRTAFRCGLVIPIPELQLMDLTNPSNYHGITIFSNINKILEKLILKRIMELEPPPSLRLWVRVQLKYSRQKTKVVYISSTVHTCMSNKLTRDKYSYWNAIAMIQKQGDTLQPSTSTCRSTRQKRMSNFV